MSELLCVTNRQLCQVDFLTRIEEIAKCAPGGIILREKDLAETEYKALAAQVLKICSQYQVPCILHSFVGAAMELRADKIHLPLPLLQKMSQAEKANFTVLGASCHSLEEASEAERLGCTYLTAGHIFATDCKKGVPPRGIAFLESICKEVSIPVYAIGGITADRMRAVRDAGAKGACIMSGLMCCENVEGYIADFGKAGENNEI